MLQTATVEIQDILVAIFVGNLVAAKQGVKNALLRYKELEIL